MENFVDQKTKNNWKFISRAIEILNGLASLVIILGIIVTYLQFKDFTTGKYSRSARLLGVYDQQMFMGNNPQIRHTIESCKAVLIESGGHFTDNQLGDYIDVFESLSIASDKDLIDKNMLYDDLGYYIDITYLNPDVQRYLKDNNDFYEGFKKLAKNSPYLEKDKMNCNFHIFYGS